MPALQNPRHEQFAQILGMDPDGNATAAYRKVYGAKDSTCAVEACRLQAIPNVALRISEVQKGFAQWQEERAKMGIERRYLTKERTLELLHDIVETPCGDVDERSELCQYYERIETENGEIVKTKMPCKLKAMELSLKTQGHLTEKTEVVQKGDPNAPIYVQLPAIIFTPRKKKAE